MRPSDRLTMVELEDDEDGTPLYEMAEGDRDDVIRILLFEAIMAIGAPELHRMVDEAAAQAQSELN